MKESVVNKLKEIAGADNVRRAPQDMVAYSYDATLHTSMPEAVVMPTTTEQVSAVMRVANEEHFPVTPRGSGTGLSGGSVPVKGGLVMSFTRMNRITEIDQENLLAVVEPGVINLALDQAVEKKGLFYPPDPASKKICTMGGNVAECAGGPRGFKYGCTREYVLGLEAVLPTGEVLRAGCRTVKGVTGFDLTRLICASEGVLALVTSITCKLLPLPEHTETMLAIFDDLADAGRAVSNIIAAGVIPCTLEFMDHDTLGCVEAYTKIGLPVDAAALLLIETDGYREAAVRQADLVMEICRKSRARTVKKAESSAERESLWTGRRSALAAITRIKPSLVQEDTVVPRSKVAEMALGVVEIGRKYQLHTCSYGHAGDGNLHPSILTDVRDKDEMSRVDDAVKAMFDLALELGGTISGEHGIGVTKAPYLKSEIGEVGIDAMRKLKKAWDPNNVLNPGKMSFE